MYLTLYVEDAPQGGIVRVPSRRVSYSITPGTTIADVCQALALRQEAAA